MEWNWRERRGNKAKWKTSKFRGNAMTTAREEWITWTWSGGRGEERRQQPKSSAAKVINASARLQCSLPLNWRWFSHRVTSHKTRLFTRRANHATVNMSCGYPITSRGKERRFQESLSTDQGGTKKVKNYHDNLSCKRTLQIVIK